MSRIERCLQELQQTSSTALIPFITAGDPSLAATLPLMQAMVAAGANLIELGVPFSDPMAEGPVIQRACERALANKAFLPAIFSIVRAFRNHDKTTPVVLMGYLNPLEHYGYAAFARDAAAAGVDGVLTVDLPTEEAEQYRCDLLEYGLDPIFLLAPNSPQERIEQVNALGRGFVYYVSIKGVTGADSLHSESVQAKLDQIRQFCHWPLAVGFGIKDANSARRIAQWADAVVVGSAVIKLIESGIEQNSQLQSIVNEVAAFIKTLREAIDNDQ